MNFSKINICIFSGDISRHGGTERVAIALAESLQALPNFSVSIVSLTEANLPPAFPINTSIPRFKLSKKWVQPGPGYFPLIWRLFRLVKKQNFSVIIDVDTVLDILSIPCKWLTKVKVISWEHFNYFEVLGTSYRTLCRRVTCLFSDSIVTLTEKDAENWKNNGKPRCPVTAIPNLTTYLSDEDFSAPIFSREKIILSVGALVPIKGFEDIILIARKIIPSFPDWKFLIVGNGPEKDKLHRLIHNNHLENHIILMDFDSNISSLYKKASIYLMTSRSEGLSMVLIEAKYFHLPSVSYDISYGPGEIILDQTNGFLLPPGDIDTMVQKLSALMSDETLRHSFSKHAWDNIDKFNNQTILSQWTTTIRSLFSGAD